MNPATVITSGLLLLVALLFVCASSANFEPGEPLFPTVAERGDLTFGILSLACAFAAGALL